MASLMALKRPATKDQGEQEKKGQGPEWARGVEELQDDEENEVRDSEKRHEGHSWCLGRGLCCLVGVYPARVGICRVWPTMPGGRAERMDP